MWHVDKKVFKAVLVAIAIYCNFANAVTNPVQKSLTNPSQSKVKSFKQWKKSQREEVEARVKMLKQKMDHQKNTVLRSRDPNLKSKEETEAGLSNEIQDKLDQELLNLSMSKELSMSDYIVGYLSKQPSLEQAIRDVSGRLTAEEVAVLMEEFARHVSQSKSNQIK